MGDFPYKRNREEFEKTLSEYGVVVFDEVHFAISDAGFNVYTAEIMDYLLERVMKYKIPRVYLTGTANPVLNYLYEKELVHNESLYHKSLTRPPMFYYCYIERNYDYLNMRQFKNNEEIIEKINTSNMKWLIFVDKKSLAKTLLKEIKREKVIYICADNQGDEEVKEIIKGLVDEDKMKADVLIATTVLDVGINIKDPVNVVSYLTERNTFNFF